MSSRPALSAHSLHGHQPAATCTQIQPSLGPVTGKAPGKQASLPRKEVETPTEARTQREAGRDLEAQTQRKEARIRAEAQTRITFLHRGQAHVGGHGHQNFRRGPALLEPAELIKVGGPVPPPGLGPNCPGGPGRGEPSLRGQSQAAKQGDTEMPPRSPEEGVLEYLDGYTVWAEAGSHPCSLPRRSA